MVHCGACEACLAGHVNVCRNLRVVGIDYPGAIAGRTAVPEYGIYPLPEDVDLVAAALIEPVAVAVRAVRRSGLALGQHAHVVGAGPIGCLVGLLAAAAGATVTLSEPSVSRSSSRGGSTSPLWTAPPSWFQEPMSCSTPPGTRRSHRRCSAGCAP
ncbi:MAG: hypothetical protein ACJ780_18755 [Solirubrobacteraceae bacterium]